MNPCKFKLVCSGPEAGIIIFNSQVAGDSPILQTYEKTAEVNFVNVDHYYLFLQAKTISVNKRISPFQSFNLTFYTYCDNFCMNPADPFSRPGCTVCGDGVRDRGEQCDNGNKPGCVDCLVVPGYECIGNYGGSTMCSKSPVCGDEVVDQG